MVGVGTCAPAVADRPRMRTATSSRLGSTSTRTSSRTSMARAGPIVKRLRRESPGRWRSARARDSEQCVERTAARPVTTPTGASRSGRRRALRLGPRLVATRRTSNQDFYKRMRAKSGVTFVGHDARRWCATMMAAAGIPLEVIGRVLGHSDQSVTARHYAKASYANEMRRALEVLARHLDATLRQAEPTKVVALPVRSA